MATEEDFDRWIEITKQCKYLPENELKVYVYYINNHLYTSYVCYSFCVITFVTCCWKSVTYNPCLLRLLCVEISMDK